MMDALHRALTGQTLTPKELRIGARFVICWFLMDVAQFVDFVVGKFWP